MHPAGLQKIKDAALTLTPMGQTSFKKETIPWLNAVWQK